MAGNLISSGTAQRLVENTYLHSNTENFLAVANQMRKFDLKEENIEFEKMLKKMEAIINKLEREINIMYNDLQLDSIDTHNKNSDGSINYFPDGATAFRNKFLIRKLLLSENDTNIIDDDNIGVRLNTAVNSIPSQKALEKIYAEVKKNRVYPTIKEIIEEDDNLFSSQEKEVLQWLAQFGGININNKISSLLSSRRGGLFVNKQSNGKNYFRIKGLEKRTHNDKDLAGDFNQKIIKDFFKLEEMNLSNSKDVKEIQSRLEQIYINKFIFREVGEKYYSEFLSKFLKGTILENDIAFKEKFVNSFEQTCMRYSKLSFSQHSTSSTRGFIGEFGLFLDFDENFDSDTIVKILGQELETRIIKDKKFNTKNKTWEKSSTPLVSQSASDISIIVNGKEYRLQVKNSLAKEKGWMAFRIQDDIDLTKFMEMAISSQQLREVISYLLVNTAFLKKYGLGKFSEPQTIDLLKMNNKDLEYYINFLISQGYEYILSYRYPVNSKNMEVQQKGNVAFVYQNKFLIPIGAFFISAYNLLVYLKNKLSSKSVEISNSIGGISFPSFSDIKKGLEKIEKPIDNLAFQEEKQKVLKRGLKANEGWLFQQYKYPTQLVEYGSDMGRDILDILKIKLRISLQLEELTNLMRI